MAQLVEIKGPESLTVLCPWERHYLLLSSGSKSGATFSLRSQSIFEVPPEPALLAPGMCGGTLILDT